ncbi:MAG: energy transducer TonB [Betaproteobacteria bacterium]
MNATITHSSYGTQDPSSRVKGIVIVVALHVLIGYALVSGMARKGLELVKKPLEAVVIQEVIIPPPPPPPPPKKVEPPKEMPKVQAPPPPFVPPPDVAPPVASTAPAIVATHTPSPAPAVIAPPAPPAPPAPAAPAPAPVVAGPKRSAIGVACPTQVAPEMPRKAIQDGTEGVVKAQILIRNGVVQEVTIVSGPRVFHSAVKNAIAQYKCVADGPEVLATQEFNFKVE